MKDKFLHQRLSFTLFLFICFLIRQATSTAIDKKKKKCQIPQAQTGITLEREKCVYIITNIHSDGKCSAKKR